MTKGLAVVGEYVEMDIEGEADGDGYLGIYIVEHAGLCTAHINKQNAVDIIKHLTEVFDL